MGGGDLQPARALPRLMARLMARSVIMFAPRSGRGPATAFLLAAAMLFVPVAALAAQEPAADSGHPVVQEPGPEEPAAAGREPAPPGDAAGPLRLTLDEAIETALRRSPDLAVSAADLDRAESARLSAWGSFLPRIDAGYGYSTSSSGRLDPTGQSITNTSWSTQLTASYDVFSGLRRFNDLSSARGRVEAASALHREQRFRTILDVKRAYFAALASRELSRVQADRVERQEAQLESVRLQLDMGRASRPDVLRSRIALNQARLDLIRAQSDVRSSAWGLAAAIGADRAVEPAEPPEGQGRLRPLELTREQVRSIAVRSAPSLVSAEAAADAAGAAVASARSAYLPSLTVAGGYAWQSTAFPPENRSWRIFAFGSYPLFDGFQRENRVAQARADARTAEALERAARLSIRAAADSAYRGINTALASIDLAEQTAELTREELEMQRELFRLGRGSILELQAAQIALAEAEVASVQARFDYRTSVARLEFLLGRELESGAEARADAPVPDARSAAARPAAALSNEPISATRAGRSEAWTP